METTYDGFGGKREEPPMGEQRQRSVQEIASDVGQVASEIYGKLDIGREMREHPYRTLAIAAGVGYVMGGGIFTPLTAGIFRLGLRAMAIPAVQTILSQVASGAEAPPPDYFD